MTSQKYDLVAIGSGPGSRRAAIQAAKLGKRVLVVESASLGGVSVHTGTIPSKTIRETVLNLTGFRERNFYERQTNKADLRDIFDRLNLTQRREVSVMQDQFERNGVDTLIANASFLDSHTIRTVEADGKMRDISAGKTIIAVGTCCYRPDNIDFDGKYVCDSDQILRVERIPSSVTIIGAGVIGVEYASILNVLGKEITIVDPRKDYLEFIDREIIEAFTGILQKRGVQFRLGRKLSEIISISNEIITLKLDDGELLQTGMVLYAAGRMGATSRLNLESCGIETDARDRITVNPETFQTSTENIYAVGDVIGFPALASTSMSQGRIAACHAFGEEAHELPKFFPYGIYSVPEISTSGASETQLQSEAISYVTGIAQLRETSRGQIMGVDNGFLKMLFERKGHRLLGVHIIGEGAAELIHIGQAVMQFNGTIDYFIENVFNFPTLAEAYKVAALNAWNKLSREPYINRASIHRST